MVQVSRERKKIVLIFIIVSDSSLRTGDLGKYSFGKELIILGRLSSAVLLDGGEVLCPGALEAFLVAESDVVNQVRRGGG